MGARGEASWRAYGRYHRGLRGGTMIGLVLILGVVMAVNLFILQVELF
jgi:hypothetical protein